MAPKPVSKQAFQVAITDDDDSDAQAMWQMNVKVTSWALSPSLVSIRVGLEGDRIYDSLVVDQLVTFILGEGVQLIVFGIAYNLV